MAITFEETVQTVLNLVRQNEQLQQTIVEKDARIRELEQAQVTQNPHAKERK